MKTVIVSVVAAFALSALVAAPSVIAQQRDKAKASTSEAKKDAQTECMEMMQGFGTTEEGKKAMQEFMQSPKAPQAMNKMMEMARRMGNGDTMLGMTKMMEMMGAQGGMGGMMGGEASPGMHPQK
jgi:hypothetical protein